MQPIKITTPILAINTYVVIDPNSKKAAVIDATRDVQPVLDIINKEKLDVIAILETHVHADFVSGSKEMKDALNNKPSIFCSGMGGEAWIPHYVDFVLEDREEIILGSIRLQAWHTPGHTPEHVTWVIYDDEKDEMLPLFALTGDFLFFGSIGRPDLLGEKQMQSLAHDLYNSVFHILPYLPDSMEIYPAHGAGSLCGKSIGSSTQSTLGIERQNNLYMQTNSEQAWIESILKDMPKAPDYFPYMKEVNIIGAPLIKELAPIKEISFHELDSKKGFLIDIRSKEDFAKNHFKGSINIPIVGAFLRWAPVIVPYEENIIIIANDNESVQKAISGLHVVGLDKIDGYCIYQIGKGGNVSSFEWLKPYEVFGKLEKNDDLVVIDVRTDKEWNEGHIPGAQHIELNEFSEALENIPKDKLVGTVCDGGYRASIAASILKKEDYRHVFSIEGGMKEWRNAQLPQIQ